MVKKWGITFVVNPTSTGEKLSLGFRLFKISSKVKLKALASRMIHTLDANHYFKNIACERILIRIRDRIHSIFKELELVGKFFKRATKNWKTLSDHALQAYVHSRLRLLHVDNVKIILSLQKQLNLEKNNKC